MNGTEERPSYFATKYDSARDEIVGQFAFEPDESSGDVEAPTGFFALVLLAGTADELTHEDYARELAETYGVEPSEWAGSWIVTSTDQGFVYVEQFETEAAAREQFECLSGRYSFWVDEERDEDSDGVYVCPVQGHGYHQL